MEKIKKSGKKTKNGKTFEIKQRKALRYFDRSCLFLLLVLLAAFLVCYGKPYELQAAVSHGHAVWFLLLVAYPVLGLLGLINVLLGTSDAPIVLYFTVRQPIFGLILADVVYLLLLWLILRRRGGGWFGPGGLHAAGNFVLIVACWGIFQLFLSGVMFLWNSGGLTPFYPHDPPAAAAPVQPATGDRAAAAPAAPAPTDRSNPAP